MEKWYFLKKPQSCDFFENCSKIPSWFPKIWHFYLYRDIKLPFTNTGHCVPEQYSIQKEYPKHSVSRKNLFLYSNLRNNFQTNQKLGAFWEKMFLLFSNGVIFTQPCHFQEVFGRYLWNGPSTVKIEKSHFLNSYSEQLSPWTLTLIPPLGPSGTIWDLLGPP